MSTTTQPAALRTPITGPTVWNRDSLRTADYVLTVTPEQAAACLRLRDDLRSRGRHLPSVVSSDFAMAELAELGHGILQRIRFGPGFCVLRGLPLDGWTDDEASMLYWGLGTYLGGPLPQNRNGDRVYLVQDTGMTVAETRGSKTNSELIFHTDSSCAFAGSRPDVLGLLCLRKAVSGGESLMASGHTVYNTLLETDPEAVEELYQPTFLFDRSHETVEGEDPVSIGSIFTDTEDGGVQVRYNRLYLELGHYRSGQPLTDRQRRALDAFDRVITDPANQVEFTLHPGDVFFADNHAALHNRKAFVDAEEVSERRCLVRLWLGGEPHN